MSPQDRHAASDLKRSIHREAYRFDFFQLVYLLERWRRRADDGSDGRIHETAPPGIGHQGPLSAEGLRLRPDRGLAFSPADVRWAGPLPAKEDERGKMRNLGVDDEIYQVIVNFMGLYGFSTPTPIYFTELINSPEFDAGPLLELLDVFNHRMISFYYRSWQKYRYPYRYESGARDELSAHILSFVGLRGRSVQELTCLPIPRLIRYVGLMAPRTRPLINLRLMLADYFKLNPAPRPLHVRQLGDDSDETAGQGVKVRIKPFILRWIEVAPEQRNRIGMANSNLGQDLTLGSETPDRAGKFRVLIGPMPYAEFRRFLPDSENFRQLSALVHLWVGDRFDFDFQFIIRRQDIPEARMSGAEGAQLGWTGWITSQPGLDRDPAIIFPKRRPVPNQGTAAA